MRVLPHVAAITLPFLVMTPPAHADGRKVDLDHLKQADELIAQSIEKKEIPGAVLLVGRGDDVVYRKAYGNRALEPAVEPMTVDTIFDIASLSKPLGTATSIMILADRGKLDVHAPVAKYVP